MSSYKYDSSGSTNKPTITRGLSSTLTISDFGIETFFGDGKETVSAKDKELQKTLEMITQEYMKSFDNINKLSNQKSGTSKELSRFATIKKEFKDLDDLTMKEHGNFINELSNITNNSAIKNCTYKNYVKEPTKYDKQIKKLIDYYKYDIILDINKNNSSEKVAKLTGYVNKLKETTKKKKKFTFDDDDKDEEEEEEEEKEEVKEEDEDSYEEKPKPKKKKKKVVKEIEEDEPAPISEVVKKPEKKPEKKPKEKKDENDDEKKYKVFFKFTDKMMKKEFLGKDSGEELYMFALDQKDEPEITDVEGRSYTYEELKDLTVKEIFDGIDTKLIIK